VIINFRIGEASQTIVRFMPVTEIERRCIKACVNLYLIKQSHGNDIFYSGLVASEKAQRLVSAIRLDQKPVRHPRRLDLQ